MHRIQQLRLTVSHSVKSLGKPKICLLQRRLLTKQFRSLADNVRKSIAFLKESPLIPDQLKSNIRGFVFDIKTGELEEAK